MEYKVFQSESGLFFCDDACFAVKFEAAEDNIVAENKYRHFIVPEGVVGFCEEFGRSIIVTERFILPEALREIGNVNWQHPFGRWCVFANTMLPAVVIPDSAEIGTFAFGNSKIDLLCLPEGYPKNNREYARQFKGAHVHRLFIHVNDVPSRLGVFTMLPYYVDEVYTYRNKESNCLPIESEFAFSNMYNG